MNYHLIPTVAFAVFLTLTAISSSMFHRLIFAVISLILFYTTFFVFAYEYDKEQMVQWKKRLQKLTKK